MAHTYSLQTTYLIPQRVWNQSPMGSTTIPPSFAQSERQGGACLLFGIRPAKWKGRSLSHFSLPAPGSQISIEILTKIPAASSQDGHQKSH